MADNMKQSLCAVIRSDRGIGTRLRRLADIEDGRLVVPPAAPEDNWNMMYWPTLKQINGPTALGTLGIWQWYGSPNYMDPNKIYIITEFLTTVKPVRAYTVPAADPRALCEALQDDGVPGREEDLRTPNLFFGYADEAAAEYTGTLLPAEECAFRNGRIYPASDKINFSIYRVSALDLFSCQDGMLTLPSCLGTPVSSITAGNMDQLIENSLVEALSWPYYKNHTGGNRLDWRTTKDLIHGLFTESVKEKVMRTLGISSEEADHVVAKWVDKASSVAEFGAEDAQLMAAVAMKNDEVHKACMEKAAAFWETENAAKISKAKEALLGLEDQIEKRKIEDAAARKTRKAEDAAARKELDALRKQTADAKKNLEDIEAKIASDQKLAEDTTKAVQEKIAGARQNMADFLAELSVFMPLPQPQPIILTPPEPTPAPAEPAPAPAPVPQPEPAPAPAPAALSRGKEPIQPVGYTYTKGDARAVINRVFNSCKSWKDTLNMVSRNLNDIVSPALRPLTAAYLYAAHLCRAQILAVGPCGQHLADALCAAVDGKRSGAMRLESGCGYDAADALLRGADHVITIQNLFRSGAVDFLPQALENAERCILWLHPYAEDLAIEPAGLYSYMLPMLTEPILLGKTVHSISFGSRSAAYTSFQPRSGPLLFAQQFGRLRLSGLVLQQLNRLLYTAAALAEDNQADIELLFGLLPFCTALGRQDILREVLAGGQTFLPDVAAAAERYAAQDDPA